MINNIYERILLSVFIFVNIALYFYSYDGATFIEGADSSQYYLPALSFLESGKFIRGGDYLTFGPPLYSIFLAVPIGMFGVEGSSLAIIILQAVLLFLTGYIFKLIFLSIYSGAGKNTYSILLYSLIVLNPNSLITAHLVQSETLFTFLFSIMLFFFVSLLNNVSLKKLILIGLFAGLATLVRPVSLYFLIASPVFLWFLIKILSKKVDKFKLFIPLIIGAIVISPWYVRNYIEFEKVFYTSNAGQYLELQYIQLKNKGSGWSREQGEKYHNERFEEYLKIKDKDQELCLQHKKGWACNSALSKFSLQLILDEPISTHVKALSDSWVTLLFAGGASNIRNYLGIEGKKAIVDFQNSPFTGLESIKDYLNKVNFSYMSIFIITTLFSVITRAVGVIGIFCLIKNREWRPYVILFLGVVLLFGAAYLYLGQSRFRVPLDPILMLFTVFGIIYLKRKDDKYK
jgi:4-amino-4-deoxy-L-arabinose transferase-like glycosyltransferase